MYYIGIDLGGTNIAAGVVNDDCKIIVKGSVPTNLPRSAEEIIRDMAQLSLKLIKDAGLTVDDIEWIGVGTPGAANNATGIVEYANNLQFYDVPMRDIMKKYIDRPIYIGNDANVAALGEAYAGAAKDVNDAIMVTLGTGVGGGIIIDKKVYCGFNFYGGELGHMVIEYNGRACTCGRKGCWEAYSSATALIAMTKEAMKENRDTIMWSMVDGDINKVGGKLAFAAMKKGDAVGAAVVDKYISYLACGLANIINIFQPEIICIGGGVCNEGEYLTKPLGEKIDKEIYTRNSENKPKIKIAALGNDAGIIGAAMLGK